MNFRVLNCGFPSALVLGLRVWVGRGSVHSKHFPV
jgi:hypothetical protein